MSDVLTLPDLEAWSRASPSLAVLGHPIGHSLSPPMHNAALAQLARTRPEFADWRYFRFDVPPADLARALVLLHARGFRGVNLTVPHKVLAFDLVAEIDDDARPVGAVNTLRWTPAGWRGFNTDGYGLSAALRATLGFKLAGRPVVLLGAGGAARGAAIECLQRGCSRLASSTAPAPTWPASSPSCGPAGGRDSGARRQASPPLSDDRAGTVVINATSAGLRAEDAAPSTSPRCPTSPASTT